MTTEAAFGVWEDGGCACARIPSLSEGFRKEFFPGAQSWEETLAELRARSLAGERTRAIVGPLPSATYHDYRDRYGEGVGFVPGAGYEREAALLGRLGLKRAGFDAADPVCAFELGTDGPFFDLQTEGLGPLGAILFAACFADELEIAFESKGERTFVGDDLADPEAEARWRALAVHAARRFCGLYGITYRN